MGSNNTSIIEKKVIPYTLISIFEIILGYLPKIAKRLRSRPKKNTAVAILIEYAVLPALKKAKKTKKIKKDEPPAHKKATAIRSPTPEPARDTIQDSLELMYIDLYRDFYRV
ncbi:hypothetical protein B0H65DRAFT_446672 [Neurospora tetraspora]|uniref:Uncharacterized protein n=1 Tax=Neurospora tetraspora TaxID=94610 RepID=A0AAE0J141_9PEZI|nr:hypothetical protein B0H65DRAFT_446672 [Neurospora tetraspora]